MAKDLNKLNAYEMGLLMQTNKLDPIYLLEFYLNCFANSNFNTKSAFVSIMKRRAKKEAYSSWKRQKEGRRKNLLDGIPIGWKDMIDIEKFPAFAGSKALQNIRKNEIVRDAEIVSLAMKGGLVSLAKTSTVEFAFGGLGTNTSFYLPKLIKNGQEFASGGSSTGSAFAVAKGLIPISIGTDTAGSVRIPSAWNNLIGFKPSKGRISTKGVIPLSKTYDAVGILSKCVKDIQLTYNILKKKIYKYDSLNLNNIKAKVVKDFNLEQLKVNDQKKFYKIFNKFSIKGINISYKKFPEFNQLNEFLAENGSIVNYEAWKYWNYILKGNFSNVDPNVVRRLKLGKSISIKKKLYIKNKINLLNDSINTKMLSADILMLPTIAISPPKLEYIEDLDRYNFMNNKVLSNTRIANIFNLCAISIPISKKKNNWLSLSILAREKEEEKLLCIAKKCESILNNL